MATKDIIYLALVGMAAAVFYLHGYLSGLNRGRQTMGQTVEDMDSMDRDFDLDVAADETEPGENRVRTYETVGASSEQPSIDGLFGRN